MRFFFISIGIGVGLLAELLQVLSRRDRLIRIDDELRELSSEVNDITSTLLQIDAAVQNIAAHYSG